ncbi:TlpA family protein disulfide reductase [Maribacter antarcticus]|uniref:TlpA family protein disulfide reductase n=1 Tax=Maribacter antarcticus TaxID=505250 RepID=UPI00047940B8|nr:TlpA disulfide reductase family protein [Maribacter antarcticus]
MIKPSIIIFLLTIIIFGCKEKIKNPFSVIEVNVTNHQLLDSLIIYDKEMSWEIKSILRFKESNSGIDTMNILENKLYQIYSFSNGKQGELGELLISPNSQISLSIDENELYESINYTGNFKLSNNFLAYSKKHQNQLSQIVRNGIEQKELKILIHEKGDLINKKGISLNIVDSLSTYAKAKFSEFSDILKQKNTKYLYKTSLVNEIGNNFSFTDMNNNNISLKDFQGKYLYIDVWATWCKPCKIEYVFLKELEEHFSNNDELQIISISTDREFDKWEKYITKNSIKGTQLYSGANSDFVKFYDIGALPRFIFLDKEGRVISPVEIRPSNPELLKKLESTVYNNGYN